MSEAIRLRAALYEAIAELGEKKVKQIIAEVFGTIEDDHWYPDGRR
jgi:hypothetical protein